MTNLQRVVARLAALPDARTDAGLIADFLRNSDQRAFAELVRRHGPMVLGVCRRALGPDADDAFQATFLVLVRRARHTAWRDALGPWLYGVAVRVARKARAARARRQASERQASPMTPEPTVPAADPDDLTDVLDQELAALPETFRRPLVLCELEGRSRADAARVLGLPEGTLSSRLARGRRMLRDRLARRGVVPAAAGLAVAVPAGLAEATTERAVAVLTGAAGAVPAAVMSLTEGVVKTMLVNSKLAALAVTVGLGLAGFGTWGGAVEPPAPAAASPKAAPPPRTGPASEEPDGAVATIFGDVRVSKDAYADYLIRRAGQKELELFVRKQIIAHAFGRKGWTLRAEDVEAALNADCRALGVSREEFDGTVLRRYGKTEMVWMEDVVTPRLMLAQLCGAEVKTATEAELRAAFDRKYGEKRECRVIVWPNDHATTAPAVAAKVRAVVEELRAGEEAFDAAARRQSSPTLAASGGRVAPLPAADGVPGVSGTVNDVAVGLKPGEVSRLIETPNDVYLLKCDRILPPDPTKTFAAEKGALLAEVLREKIDREIPRLFDELNREARPRYHVSFPDPVARPNPAPSTTPK
jgi:RNA polymerase sigma factor (sigma-70 family)